jgi:hypothetical protein
MLGPKACSVHAAWSRREPLAVLEINGNFCESPLCEIRATDWEFVGGFVEVSYKFVERRGAVWKRLVKEWKSPPMAGYLTDIAIKSWLRG